MSIIQYLYSSNNYWMQNQSVFVIKIVFNIYVPDYLTPNPLSLVEVIADPLQLKCFTRTVHDISKSLVKCTFYILI